LASVAYAEKPDNDGEHGNSGQHDPDDDGRGPDRGEGKPDDTDGDHNNGSGNDPDHCDDNEGRCGNDGDEGGPEATEEPLADEPTQEATQEPTPEETSVPEVTEQPTEEATPEVTPLPEETPTPEVTEQPELPPPYTPTELPQPPQTPRGGIPDRDCWPTDADSYTCGGDEDTGHNNNDTFVPVIDEVVVEQGLEPLPMAGVTELPTLGYGPPPNSLYLNTVFVLIALAFWAGSLTTTVGIYFLAPRPKATKQEMPYLVLDNGDDLW